MAKNPFKHSHSASLFFHFFQQILVHVFYTSSQKFQVYRKCLYKILVWCYAAFTLFIIHIRRFNFMQLFQLLVHFFLTCFSAWFSRFSARHSSPFPTLVGAKTIGPSSFASANPRRRKLMSSLLPNCESSASVSRAFRVLQTKEKKEIIGTSSD